MSKIAYYFCLLGAIFVWPAIAELFSDIVDKKDYNLKSILFLSIYTFAFILSFYE